MKKYLSSIIFNFLFFVVSFAPVKSLADFTIMGLLRDERVAGIIKK
ncbi:MAG: hypothetical protein ACIPMY_05425 [Rickettsia endosymbiont of Pentastiridius leporinus]